MTMRKIFNAILGILLLLGGIYLVGPRVATPELNKPFPTVPKTMDSLQFWVQQQEAQFPNIRPNNAAQIIFYDSIPQKTPVSVLYLHGFSASQGEGAPAHLAIAKALKANLYLPRLWDHGLVEDDPLLDFTAEQYIDSAREAIAVAAALGERVVVLGTSTGGTLALALSTHPQIAAMGLFSPNVAVFDKRVGILSKPWGLQLARFFSGGNFHTMDKITAAKKAYWTTRYRVEAGPHLQKLLDVTMKKQVFNTVKQPVFMGYYYKDEIHQDSVVSVAGMKKMFAQLGTPDSLKQAKAYPNAGDHVIVGQFTNPNYQEVVEDAITFFNRVLQKP